MVRWRARSVTRERLEGFEGELVWAETSLELRTRWFSTGWAYQRPVAVEPAHGTRFPIRDYVMVAKLVAAALNLMSTTRRLLR